MTFSLGADGQQQGEFPPAAEHPVAESELSEEDIRIIEERSATKGRDRPIEEFIEDIRSGKIRIGEP